MKLQGVQEKIVFFPRIFVILHWPPIGCTEIGQINQPMGVTVHSHRVENFENILQWYVGEKWVAVDNEKTEFFLNTR